jgi:hypothetical protein
LQLIAYSLTLLERNETLNTATGTVDRFSMLLACSRRRE